MEHDSRDSRTSPPVLLQGSLVLPPVDEATEASFVSMVQELDHQAALTLDSGQQSGVEPPAPASTSGSDHRYVERRPIGKGGMGEVVLAYDRDILRPVAIKRMHQRGENTDARRRFADEIRTVGQLEHPNIVPIHDVGVDAEGNLFFVMTYVQGETLGSIIKKLSEKNPEYERRFTHSYRVQVFIEILRAMHHAHGLGIIHRDLKPDNIMVDRYGGVKVMDWGLAKRFRSQSQPASTPAAISSSGVSLSAELAAQRDLSPFETAVGTILGTVAYMSPEQARGQIDALDERSDIYSLGAIFYELMSLRHYLGPHRSTNYEMLAAIMFQPLKLSQRRNDFAATGAPMVLAHYVARGLAKDPADRFPSVAVMIERLQRIQDNRIPIECPITFMQRCGQEFLRLMDRFPVLFSLVLLISLGFLGYELYKLVFPAAG